MELTVARAIINVAIEGKYDIDMPEDPDDVVDLGESLYEHALKEPQRDTYIEQIISLGADDEVNQIIPNQRWAKAPQLKGEPTELPRDLTTLNDLALRRLYSEFGAWLTVAKERLSLEEADLSSATYLRDDAYRKALAKVERVDEETGKSKLKEVMDIEAREDKEFQKWEANVRAHTVERNKLKALVEIYSGNCDRISREATMRHNEWERQR